jgi:hypothetical protein
MDTIMTFMYVNGTKLERTVDLRKRPSYDELEMVMGPVFDSQRGGKPTHFEHVSVLWDGKPADMFVDENGAVHGMALPVNEEATKIYHAASIKRDNLRAPSGIISGAPKIHGTAVIFNRRVWF